MKRHYLVTIKREVKKRNFSKIEEGLMRKRSRKFNEATCQGERRAVMEINAQDGAMSASYVERRDILLEIAGTRKKKEMLPP